MSSANIPNRLSYDSRGFFAPKAPWWKRINFRVIVFAAVIVTIVGVPIYWFLDETITGGVHDHGTYKEVNLKAMSSFDMDQENATMDDIPQKFRDLEGDDVLMIGEMWAPKDAGDGKLSYFQLVYSKTKCCFNGPPLAQHFVDGNVVTGATVYYYDVPVKVWGKVHIYVRKEGDVIKSIYHVDVHRVEPIDNQ
jgi:hypothetical protein